MIKTASVALACAAMGVAFVPAAQAETKVYVNPEYNQGFLGAQSLGGVLNLDVGVENGPFYAQLGPALATAPAPLTGALLAKRASRARSATT